MNKVETVRRLMYAQDKATEALDTLNAICAENTATRADGQDHICYGMLSLLKALDGIGNALSEKVNGDNHDTRPS